MLILEDILTSLSITLVCGRDMYYFEDPEKQSKLKDVLESWLGTPFRHWSGVKGLGCDCIHFVTGVMTEMGIVHENGYEIQRYARDWHIHNEEELLLEGVRWQFNAEEVSISSPANGDIFLFQFGRTCSHAGIYCDDHIYQAINNIGTRKLPSLDRQWHKRKRYNFRILI